MFRLVDGETFLLQILYSSGKSLANLNAFFFFVWIFYSSRFLYKINKRRYSGDHVKRVSTRILKITILHSVILLGHFELDMEEITKYFLFVLFSILLSHLHAAGCDIGVRFSVRPSVNIDVKVRHLCQS